MSRIVLALDSDDVDDPNDTDIDMLFLISVMRGMNKRGLNTPWAIFRDGHQVDGEGHLEPPIVTLVSEQEQS